MTFYILLTILTVLCRRIGKLIYRRRACFISHFRYFWIRGINATNFFLACRIGRRGIGFSIARRGNGW